MLYTFIVRITKRHNAPIVRSTRRWFRTEDAATRFAVRYMGSYPYVDVIA